jgi:hypothetical protein
MKKLILIALIVLATNVNGQSSKTISKPSEFNHPVMLKLIQGDGNIFRIGFIRDNDYKNVKEDVTQLTSYYARFLDDNELKNKTFVYFPLSEKTGEMLIVEKSILTNLDLSYEEAMKIILPK